MIVIVKLEVFCIDGKILIGYSKCEKINYILIR